MTLTPADWLMWRRTYNGWGYSPLDQINRDNVDKMQLVWSYALDPYQRGVQAEPIVYGGVIYLRHPSELVSAHDAATGDLIWSYRRELPEDIVRVPGITVHRGRGMSLYGNKLINFSTDGFLYALDAGTGELIWEARMVDYRETRQQASGAPIVYNGVVVVPFNCTHHSSMRTCHLSAYDAETGKMLWRWFTSPGPDDPLHDTWGEDPQRYPLESRLNTSAWMTPAVDTERGLFIFGVGSSAPMQPEVVGTDGKWPDRLYHGSTVALDHRTGKVVWWAQHQSDMHNNDSVFDRILVDARVNPHDTEAPWLGRNPDIRPGQTRQLVVGSFSKDGIFLCIRSNQRRIPVCKRDCSPERDRELRWGDRRLHHEPGDGHDGRHRPCGHGMQGESNDPSRCLQSVDQRVLRAGLGRMRRVSDRVIDAQAQ